jgi:hypothetical protein
LYENIYGEYDLPVARAAEVRREILDLHRRMGDIHAENEVKLRKILNREQFERMRALMREEHAKHPRGGRDRRPGPPPEHPAGPG